MLSGEKSFRNWVYLVGKISAVWLQLIRFKTCFCYSILQHSSQQFWMVFCLPFLVNREIRNKFALKWLICYSMKRFLSFHYELWITCNYCWLWYIWFFTFILLFSLFIFFKISSSGLNVLALNNKLQLRYVYISSIFNR